MKDKNKRKIYMVVCIAAILTFLIGIILTVNRSHVIVDETLLQQETTIQKNPESIAIPGYEMFTLKADTINQSLCLKNPHQNCCYFKITLSLADDEVLWQSDYISPGETSAAITLSRPLSKGTYTGAKLIYQCFQMNEDFTPLNGAETKLTLVVK